ncbi:MAG: nucleotidyltransferase family protein [Euryarchaeota archaeon]|nr:nucleotidyltransferase family protein [Euryarchaeota archaeon]
MTSAADIRKTLRKHKPLLRKKFKVRKIGIFGSYVRGEQSKKSDVDILVDFSEPIGWEIVDLKELLEDALGLKVDLVVARALKPRLAAGILKEVVYA